MKAINKSTILALNYNKMVKKSTTCIHNNYLQWLHVHHLRWCPLIGVLTEIFFEYQCLDLGHLSLSLQEAVSLETGQRAEDVAYSSSWLNREKQWQEKRENDEIICKPHCVLSGVELVRRFWYFSSAIRSTRSTIPLLYKQICLLLTQLTAWRLDNVLHYTLPAG